MTAWLIARGASPIAARWIIRGVVAVIAVIALGGSYAAGYRSKAYAVAKQYLREERAKVAELERLREENAKLSADLNAEKKRDRVVYRTITKQVPHVAREIVQVPATGGAAVCTVSHDYLRLWNDALFARVPEPAAGSADSASGANPAGAASSGLRSGDLLANHVENAESCHEIRRQLKRLVEWHGAHTG